MDKLSIVKKNIEVAIALKKSIAADNTILTKVEGIIDIITTAYKQKNKVLFCGNGGSAADAQHLAAELSGRYYYDRPPLNAEALHVNTSYLTAVANDYAYGEVYKRLIQAIGQEGDVLIALSTSGNSANVLNAIEQARSQHIYTIGFTGLSGGKMNAICDMMICIPSTDTPRIQECHMLLGHTICEGVEKNLFPKKND